MLAVIGCWLNAIRRLIRPIITLDRCPMALFIVGFNFRLSLNNPLTDIFSKIGYSLIVSLHVVQFRKQSSFWDYACFENCSGDDRENKAETATCVGMLGMFDKLLVLVHEKESTECVQLNNSSLRGDVSCRSQFPIESASRSVLDGCRSEVSPVKSSIPRNQNN